MAWRVVAALIIAIFAIVTVMTVVAEPLRDVADELVAADDTPGGQLDTQQQADEGIRGFENLALILIFGLISWGAWRVLRRELTQSRL